MSNVNTLDNINIAKIKSLVSKLNSYSNAYYNEQPIVSDREYDELFDELLLLENTTGFVMSNSPTQRVGFEVKGSLQKVKHSHPMLSLAKTKSIDDLKLFIKKYDTLASLKLDGLTVLLTYENGELIRAETRGNGEEGEDITHNARVFQNIPLCISYKKHLEVEGEAIITYGSFNKINEKLPNSEKYKNPRNLVSGSVRQLDSQVAADRDVRFIAWKVPSLLNINKYSDRLKFAYDLGFEVVPWVSEFTDTDIEEKIDNLKNIANEYEYPIDGIVVTYNDIPFAESLGTTSHHPKHSIAYKFYDEEHKTFLRDVEFTMGKTGILTPTAVFDPVEIDGTLVERASLSNLSIMKQTLGTPYIGQEISISKRNMIIPKIECAKKLLHPQVSKVIHVPDRCPFCNSNTISVSSALVCSNPNCNGMLLGKMAHFVSKEAMNIEGLSESTLEKFIALGWITCYTDIYYLDIEKENMKNIPGFGSKSVENLFASIEKSRNTTLDRFIYSLSIPTVGRSASKTISKHFEGNFDDFYDKCCLGEFDYKQLDGFGCIADNAMRLYMLENKKMIKDLAACMDFTESNNEAITKDELSGMTFVITGSVKNFQNRECMKLFIETHGGKVSGSVSPKTSYLVNNDITSTSDKNKKAKELGIPIITEDKLVSLNLS